MSGANNFTTARGRELYDELRALEADAAAPCDCVDCDGRWCSGCLAHHGDSACPLVQECTRELAAYLGSLSERDNLEHSFACWWHTVNRGAK